MDYKKKIYSKIEEAAYKSYISRNETELVNSRSNHLQEAKNTAIFG